MIKSIPIIIQSLKHANPIIPTLEIYLLVWIHSLGYMFVSLDPRKKFTSMGKWKWIFVWFTLITRILLKVYEVNCSFSLFFLSSIYKYSNICSVKLNLKIIKKTPFPTIITCFECIYIKFFSSSLPSCEIPMSSFMRVIFVSVSILNGILTYFLSFLLMSENFSTLNGSNVFTYVDKSYREH